MTLTQMHVVYYFTLYNGINSTNSHVPNPWYTGTTAQKVGLLVLSAMILWVGRLLGHENDTQFNNCRDPD